MPPIITLLTDFGLQDSYVAEMKAAILTDLADAVLVDVTHEVPSGDVAAARYLVSRSWKRFPPGTVHLVVVDPGVGTNRRALAACAEGHLFVAPDNGVLTNVLRGANVVALPTPPGASATFHGRDVFAPAAASLATGVPLASLGQAVTDAVRLPVPEPRVAATEVTGAVVYVDRFGTLVTNLTADHLGRCTTVTVGGTHTAPVGKTFGDVAPGALVAFVGSGGNVEVAVRDGSASVVTGAVVGTEVRLGPG
jgi:S-adenosylmethionine hydrolase